MRSLEEMRLLLEECIIEVEACGIHITNVSGRLKIAPRAKRRHACYSRTTGDITVSKHLLLDDVPEEMVKQTLCHEILHGSEGAAGHNAIWKEYAERMNRMYGYNISRCTPMADFGLEGYKQPEYKYEIRCENCGCVVARRRRKVKLVQHPEWFRHSKCGGRLVVKQII